ncbi:beta-N-acetylhexosaminidase [Flavihumibacter cheonanensis]|uniref:beta-N-acetylhexosaminidase n=1 Tax=Flavihumibacter cheonanensis TaxID=1442385 RepID=UPI001EF8E2F0|nr:family 20 glycosylhydrolase [Flavihumibacter cheonanensis]MCG7753150.1 family 20 glycosylhydrolase [Flavihumibacter cheonanensis]
MKSVVRIVCLMLFVAASQFVQAQPSLLPKPEKIVMGSSGDPFLISPQTAVVVADKSLQSSADFLNSYLLDRYGLKQAKIKKGKQLNTIQLRLGNTASTVSGAYQLEVSGKSITITGTDAPGVFYGIQTLIQLLPTDTAALLTIAPILVQDAPRFQYRGMMLDVSRHFFPADFIKKYIDLLALHKMNRLHWHLTDDHGWRIEIKKYPQLTSVGAWRNGTVIGNYPGQGNTNQRYGGFYTQAEVKDIIQYAAQRHITIVPEIEMPGHASAAIAAFPFLSCFPDQPTFINKFPSELSKQKGGKLVQETWGVHTDVYCAGNDTVFNMMQDILTEVINLFPSEYIHIGADECPKDNWKKCPRCQQRIKDLKLKDEHELQSYFVQRIEKFINSKGRVLIGWDEILEGGLAPNAVVMSWRGEAGGIEAAKQRHDVIMTPNNYVYFDYFQGKPALEPMAIGGYLTLQKVYSYEPIPASLTAEEAKHIKGVQANVWTEYISSADKVEYMTLPRMAAIADIAWTSHPKDWNDFTQRLEAQYDRYRFWNYNAAQSAYNVKQSVVIDGDQGKATVSFSTDSYQPEIYFTLDGSEPTTKSTLYKKPFDVRRSVTVKAASFKNGKQVGKTTIQQIVL